MRQKRPPGSILKYTQSFNLNPFKLNLEHGGLEINDQFQIEVGDFVARVIPDSISMERINHFREQNSDALFDLLALSITPRHFLYGKESPEGTEDRGISRRVALACARLKSWIKQTSQFRTFHLV
ncbi:hypothetical protein AFLA70_294g001301 [Aspergillus flavus AF70]|nr:hypothetical protein AFLA70_294g001301 [Aspergillus flavus AF70]